LVLVDIYVPRDTMLHRLDPRVKIIGATLLTLLCFFLSNLVILAILLVFLLALIATSGISWKSYSSSLWFVARFAIILVLLWPFFDKLGEPVLLDLWVYKITLPSLLRSIAVAMRIFVIASGWLVLMITTRHGILVRGLVKLGCPYDFGISLSIGLRYIPNLIGMIDQIKEAQTSRAFDFASGGPIKRARNFIPVLIPTIVTAMRAIGGLSEALVSRGYGATPLRTYYRDIKMRISDAAILGFIIFVVPLMIIIDIAGVISF
jgi:energy-coupling factor transport system permease protein